MSAKQDSNLHPSPSRQVPLPLDHLHSCSALALTLIQELKCLIPWPWHCLHMCTAMWLVFRKWMYMHIIEMLMHMHSGWNYHPLSKHVFSSNVITFILLNFRKMARILNSIYDFTKGFFHMLTYQKTLYTWSLKSRLKLGKNTLTEDHERWTEKYRPWERHTKDSEDSSRRRLDSLSPKKVNDSSAASDSGPWLPTPTEFEYRPKILMTPGM